MKPAVRNICGVALIGVGIIAMPLPILPGIPIVLAGVALLGREHPLITRCVRWLPKNLQEKLKNTKSD